MTDSTKSDFQRVQLMGQDYILVRAEKYQELLDKLESVDTALDAQRTRASASEHVVESLLSGRYTPEQMKMIFDAQTFGQRLQVLRQANNLNQQELAERADVSQATISKLENDKVERPAFEDIEKLSLGLEIPFPAAFEIFGSGRRLSRRGRFSRRSNVQPAERAKSYEPKKEPA